MMHLTKQVPYKLRRIVPMLGIAGAGMLLNACDKDDCPQEPQGRKVEFVYAVDGPLIPVEDVKLAAADPEISTIYLRPIGDGWDRFSVYNINFHRKNYLQPILDISAKIRGLGDYPFRPGAALPADSLWYVQHGWTINKLLQKQR